MGGGLSLYLLSSGENALLAMTGVGAKPLLPFILLTALLI